MPDLRQSAAPKTADHPRALLVTVAVLGLFLGTRAVEAFHKSLWLDELHTLHVARPDAVGETIERILPDFHAPLYFIAVHFLGKTSPHALRILSILGSLATLWVIDRMLREKGRSGAARFAAAVAFAALPFQIQYGAELRPYAWMQLAAVLLAYAGTTDRRSPRAAFWIFLAAATFGLYTHYLTAVSILAVGALKILPRRGASLGFRRTLAAGSLAVALFLPWIYYDERWIFTDPAVMTKDENVDAASQPVPTPAEPPTPRPLLTDDVLWAVPRTVAPMGGMLGRIPSILVAAGLAALSLILAAGLAANLVRRRDRADANRRTTHGSSLPLIFIATTASMIVLALSLYLWRRIAIQYFVVGAWIWPIAVASAIDGFKNPATARRAAILLAVVLAAAGFAHATGAPREDIRAAVVAAREEAGSSDAVFTAVLRQPPHYSHLEPFLVYAPDLAAVAPEKISTAETRTIFVVTRGFDWRESDAPRSVWESIADGRSITLVRRWNGGISLYRAEKK